MSSEKATGFGYKIGWLAVRASDPAAVAKTLALTRAQPSTWAQGIGAAYQGAGIFLTPPIDGWVLVVGTWVMDLPTDDKEARLIALSREFGDAQLYVTDRVVEAHAWMRATDGKLVRSFLTTGDDEIIRDVGKRGSGEPKKDATAHEEHVIAVAAASSLDPTKLDGRALTGRGLVAPAPGAPAQPAGEVFVPGRANSAWEADLHVVDLRCPKCKGGLAIGARRHGLPWEDFAYQVEAECSGTCKKKFLLRYGRGAGWASQPDRSEARLTSVAAPSELLTAAALDEWIDAELDNIASQEQYGRDKKQTPAKIARGVRDHAQTVLAALRELEKISPKPARVAGATHRELVQRMEALLEAGR
jgi:hypothetical protein